MSKAVAEEKAELRRLRDRRASDDPNVSKLTSEEEERLSKEDAETERIAKIAESLARTWGAEGEGSHVVCTGAAHAHLPAECMYTPACVCARMCVYACVRAPCVWMISAGAIGSLRALKKSRGTRARASTCSQEASV